MSNVSTTIQEASESDALRGRALTTKFLNTNQPLTLACSGTASEAEANTEPETPRVAEEAELEPDSGPQHDHQSLDSRSTNTGFEDLSGSDVGDAIEVPDSPERSGTEPSQSHLDAPSEPVKTSWSTIASTLEACFGSEGDANALTAKLREELNLPPDYPGLTLEEITAKGDNDSVLESAPSLMRAFVIHGEACNHAENEALRLAARDVEEAIQEEDPLTIYNEMLDTLEELFAKGKDIEECISTFLEMADSTDTTEQANAARSQITDLFKACIPVLQARLSNLTMAQDLVDGVQENISLTLRMEDLGL